MLLACYVAMYHFSYTAQCTISFIVTQQITSMFGRNMSLSLHEVRGEDNSVVCN